MSFGQMERLGWSRASLVRNYVALFARAADQAVEPLLASVDLRPGLDVLDLCCGQGNAVEGLRSRGCFVTGLDFSRDMLGLARQRVPGAPLVQGDAQRLPFAAGSFDRVFSNFGICHVPDQPCALEEAHRVLRPGGWLAVTAWCGPDQSPCFELVYRVIATHGSSSVRLPPGPDFHQFAAPARALSLLSAAGFQEIQWRNLPCELEFEAPGFLCEIFEKATARASNLLSGQPPERLEAIRSAMAMEVQQRFEVGGICRVPMPATVVFGKA